MYILAAGKENEAFIFPPPVVHWRRLEVAKDENFPVAVRPEGRGWEGGGPKGKSPDTRPGKKAKRTGRTRFRSKARHNHKDSRFPSGSNDFLLRRKSRDADRFAV